MHRLENNLYREDLESSVTAGCVDLEALNGARIAISGATGTVGTFLVDALMHACDTRLNFACNVVTLGRSEVRARERLPYFDSSNFSFEELDISVPGAAITQPVDIVIHLASTTHPKAYAAHPIATIESNIIGLKNMLDAAPTSDAISAVFTSSVEIYGQNRGDVDAFDELYSGYINSNTLRAGYPEAKRTGEALCQAYAQERGLGVVIPRLARIYGPTMPSSDSKASSQFLKKALAGENIVLKSAGTQLFSYQYVGDSVCGILSCLTRGERGEAYNVCGGNSNITLYELASYISELAGTELIQELPEASESAGYSTATKAVLDGSKIAQLGFVPCYGVREGIKRTFEILRELDFA